MRALHLLDQGDGGGGVLCKLSVGTEFRRHAILEVDSIATLEGDVQRNNSNTLFQNSEECERVCGISSISVLYAELNRQNPTGEY